MHKISIGGLGAREVGREQAMIVIHVLVHHFPMEIMTGKEACDCQNSEGRLSDFTTTTMLDKVLYDD